MKERRRNTVRLMTLIIGSVIAAHASMAEAGSELDKCELVLEGTARIVEFDTYTVDGATAPIAGAMVRPDGEGPFPAIVLLHRVFGVEAPDCFKKELRKYRSWGYIALLVDSNSVPREVRTGTSGETPTGYSQPEQAADGLAGAAYLASLPSVRKSEIALVGYAFGGSAILRSVSEASAEWTPASQPDGIRKRVYAAVAWHPACPPSLPNLGVPLLVITAAKDELNSSHACVSMRVAGSSKASTVEHAIFADAGHNFDVDWFTEYDPAATESAYRRVREFLAQSRAP